MGEPASPPDVGQIPDPCLQIDRPPTTNRRTLGSDVGGRKGGNVLKRSPTRRRQLGLAVWHDVAPLGPDSIADLDVLSLQT